MATLSLHITSSGQLTVDSQVLDEYSFKGIFILNDSIYMTFWKRQNYGHIKRSVGARACGGMGVRVRSRQSTEGFSDSESTL